MAISNEQITNLVPKETVDNIMKTYESIFKQHMERMEQISDSIKDLHNFISSEDKDISQNVNFKIEEIKRKIDESIEENEIQFKDLIDKLAGPNPQYDINLSAMQKQMKDNNDINIENNKLLKGLKGKLAYYIAFMAAILGLVGFIYIMVQKSNEAMLQKAIENSVTKIIESRPETYYRFQFLDKDKNGIIDAKELEQFQIEINKNKEF